MNKKKLFSCLAARKQPKRKKYLFKLEVIPFSGGSTLCGCEYCLFRCLSCVKKLFSFNETKLSRTFFFGLFSQTSEV